MLQERKDLMFVEKAVELARKEIERMDSPSYDGPVNPELKAGLRADRQRGLDICLEELEKAKVALDAAMTLRAEKQREWQRDYRKALRGAKPARESTVVLASNVTIPTRVYMAINACLSQEGISKTEFVRRALLEYLAKHDTSTV